MQYRTRVLAATVAGLSLLAACGSSSGGSTTDAKLIGEVTNTAISPERCDANKAAGKITFLTGFDYSASASIVDVIVAKAKGYFDKMCLDVDIKSSFSSANFPIVGANTAQFASSGSYAELVNNSGNGADLQAVLVYGRVAIEALLVPDKAGIKTLADLKGKTIGVKGDLPPVLVSMLNRAGLKRGADYKEVLLDGFDPKAHLDTGIDALPVYKSNEPAQLTAAGEPYSKFTLFDPATDGTPGSFGVIYTNGAFAKAHPSAVQDFVRADLKGFMDAAADPAAAVAEAVKLIDAAGNPNFLSPAGEGNRWQVESKIVTDNLPKGADLGVIDVKLLDAQLKAYTDAGVFPKLPSSTGTFSDIASSVYADGKLIWPAS